LLIAECQHRIATNPRLSLMSSIASDQPLIPPVLPATVPNVALPLDKELVLKVIPMPADCNANGDIFGGWVMAQVDLAGSVIPARHTQGRMATVAVNEFIFKQPVRVGDILSFFSEVTRIGRTSVTVKVEVFAERFRSQGKYIKVTEALVTYVAIDEQGRPREITQNK
jgi:acyl-CoA thioesterase YciA